MIRKRIAARRHLRESTKIESRGESWKEAEGWVLEDDVEEESGNFEEELEFDEEVHHKSSVETPVWSEADKAIYEQQLDHLHDQLAQALIDNQEMKVELDRYKRSEEEKSSISTKKGSQVKSGSSKSVVTEYGLYQGASISASTTQEGFESVTAQTTERRPTTMWGGIKDWMFHILNDFTEQPQSSSEDESNEAHPLQAKKLKDNVQRLASSSKPWRELGSFLVGVIQWKNASLSLVMFLIYMYCVWTGWVLQLLLMIMIIHLTVNYLRIIGMAEQFGFHSNRRSFENEYGTLGFSDKIQLIREVAQRVQNVSETVSDNLEKAENLLYWYQPQATRKIYTFLWIFFVISVCLPNSYTLTLMGLGVGFKVFIIDNIYRKYPKVKEKYDGMAKLWRSLPTKAELLQRQSMTEDQLLSSTSNTTDVVSSTTSLVSLPDTLFCERFQISIEEIPLDGWQSGKRCSIIDRERPLSGSKSGRLFLTHRFLCFERSPRPNDTADRFVIPLRDITSFAKAKPFAVLPGSGMSLEVTLKNNEKPVIFGAILHRDQAYQSICDQAMILGLDWGSDPESLDRQTSSEQDETSQSNSN